MKNKLNLIKGVSYDPLNTEIPAMRYEQRILSEATGAASYILQKALRHYQEGYTEDESVWDEWFVLWQNLGPDDVGVQLALLALLFRRHEMRHHIDSCCTPMGWHLPQTIGGFYQRVREFVRTQEGSADEREAALKLRKNLAIQRVISGNIPRIGGFGDGKPSNIIETPVATIRYRLHREFDNVAIATIETSSDVERALSVNSLLEARAVVETSGYMSGRLRAAGVSEDDICSIIKLLLNLTVNTARDDYWAILSYAFEAGSQEELAAKLLDYKRCRIVLMASWFALHIAPPTGSPSIGMLATLRFIFFFRQLTSLPDGSLENENADWESFFDAGAREMDCPPIGATLDMSKNALKNFDLRVDEEATGVQRDHLWHLAAIMRDGLEARIREGGFWLDPLGWPKMEDPMSVHQLDLNPAFDVPKGVLTAWSRLTRLSNALRVASEPDQLRVHARTLC